MRLRYHAGALRQEFLRQPAQLTLLFAYAIGRGALVILAGTFTGVIESFLQSKGAKFGTIMQQGAGFLIFLVGIYVFYQGVRSW